MAGPNAERDQQIAAKARLGQTHDAIAAEYGLTRSRVSQIIAGQNPRSAEESQRAEIAGRMRQKYDELQAIVDHPPEMHSAIGKIVIGTDGRPVINAAVTIAAIREQVKIAREYRAMFGLDLAARPGPAFDPETLMVIAELNVVRKALGAQPMQIPGPAAVTISPEAATAAKDAAIAKLRGEIKPYAIIQGEVTE